MNIKHIIGMALIAFPLVALFIAVCMTSPWGWKIAVSAYGAAALMVGIMALGCWLLDQ